MGAHESFGAGVQVQPPTYEQDVAGAQASLQASRFLLYASGHIFRNADDAGSSTSPQRVGSTFQVWDERRRRAVYSAWIPKKREGWKAEVFQVNEKEREQLCYEVRREAMARRIDFRPPGGLHNVMVPSKSLGRSKTFSIEAPDGQQLQWKKKEDSLESKSEWNLVSLPSQTLVARYSLVNSADKQRFQVGNETFTLQGELHVAHFPHNDSHLATTNRRRLSNTSASSSSSEEGPRLNRAHKIPYVGLALPALCSAAVASPISIAAWNRHCEIKDDLTNLGRDRVGNTRPIIFSQDLQGARPPRGASQTEAARQLTLLNSTTAHGKISDPRPRDVAMDLVIASLIAVLDA